MKRSYPMPDKINRVFQLAFFVLSDRELAIQVSSEAVARLEQSSRDQQKRTYYKAHNSRKVMWHDEGLLEILTMLATERYERRQESGHSEENPILTSEDLIIRYVKQVVLQAMSRSSFYATVGICQVLYAYSHSQTRAIYDWLVPYEEGFKDDSAFRLAKARLKASLKERFSAFVPNSNDPGRRNLKAERSDSDLNHLVERSLAIFTPQLEHCPPSSFFEEFAFEPGTMGLSDSKRSRYRIEQMRIHIIICPSCFNRLNYCLGNPTPIQQLSVPLLSSVWSRYSNPVASEGHLPDLTFDDFYQILR